MSMPIGISLSLPLRSIVPVTLDYISKKRVYFTHIFTHLQFKVWAETHRRQKVYLCSIKTVSATLALSDFLLQLYRIV